jgi:hypothetical protein
MTEAIDMPDATEQPKEYVAALLDTLGGRDPVEVYGETAEQVRQLCATLSPRQWTVPLAAGEWNAYQVVGHLFDVEIVFGFRWRLTLTADNPWYPGYDEKAFSQLARPAPPVLLHALLAVRAVNLALVASLTPRQLRRRGRHGEQGEEDLARQVAKIAGHDLAHLNQLRRTVEVATRWPE